MSVAAITLDDQRTLVASYEKMPNKFEQNVIVGVSGGGAPPSGPASPTPSGSEEPSTQHHYHQVPHLHHTHNHLLQQKQQQSPPPSPTSTSPLPLQAREQKTEHCQRLLEDEIENLKIEQTRLSQQIADGLIREKILIRRLANKEQEFQDYVSQITEYKAAQAPNAFSLRNALLDPAVNLLFEKLKKELKTTKAKLEETQNELAAWKFTPDSNTGKRLMAKCRLLYQENEELGKMTSNGRLAKLETELAMQKSFSEEVKKSQSELDDFLQELDEDVEGMQSTILFLQQELKTTRDRIQILEKENYQLKNSGITINKNHKDFTNSYQNATIINGEMEDTINNVEDNKIINSIPPTLTIPTTPAIIESKYQPPLETIREDSCLQVVNLLNQTTNINDVYNGTTPTIQAGLMIPPTPTPSALTTNVDDINMEIKNISTSTPPPPLTPLQSIDDGSNNSNNSVNNKLIESRKRNYECDLSENLTYTNNNSPRTLPPKKSKLRVTPMRRSSVQSIENNDLTDVCAPNLNVVVVNNDTNELPNVNTESNAITVATATIAVQPLSPSSSTAATDLTLASTETIENVSGGGNGSGSGGGIVAQRILTRRRSVRLQQSNGNDDINH